MDEQAIPSSLLSKLEKQGWYPEWDFNVASCEMKLNKQGIQLIDAAKSFLQRFGGLSITGRKKDCRYYLNPIRVLRYVMAERIIAYEEQLELPFSPVGEMDGGQMDILMDQAHSFYLVRDDTIVKIANSDFEALEYFFK